LTLAVKAVLRKLVRDQEGTRSVLQDIFGIGVAPGRVRPRPNRASRVALACAVTPNESALVDHGMRGRRHRETENAGREKGDALVRAAWNHARIGWGLTLSGEVTPKAPVRAEPHPTQSFDLPAPCSSRTLPRRKNIKN